MGKLHQEPRRRDRTARCLLLYAASPSPLSNAAQEGKTPWPQRITELARD